MAIIQPPDMRLANGVQGFSEGLRSGIGIVRDIQGIKSMKGEDERREAEEGRKKDDEARKKELQKREDEQYEADKPIKYVDRIKKMQTAYVHGLHAASTNPAALSQALEIRNMQFLPDKTGKKITVTAAELVDTDAGKIVRETFDDGTVNEWTPELTQMAFNEWPKSRTTTGDEDEDGDGSRKNSKLALERYKTLQPEVISLRETVVGNKNAKPEDVKRLSAMEKRLAALAKEAGIGMDEEVPAEGTGVSKDGLRPSQMPDAQARIAANRAAGYPKGGVPGASAPVSTPTPATAPPAQSGAPVTMTNPATGKSYQIKPEAVAKYKAAGWTYGGQ